MTYGNPIGISLPVVGVTADAAGEQLILDFLAAIDTVLSAKVTPAGLDINANLSFRSGVTAYAATDLLKANFSSQSSPLNAGLHPVAAYASGGDLYYNDGSGNQIQMTAAGAVNVSSAGGITGAGYGTGGVEVNWDSGNSKYRMRSGTATDAFGDVECDDVRLNDGSTNFVTLTAGSMAADYTMTLPTAVPAAQSLVQMDASGVLTASNTLASGQSITLQGSGQYKRPARIRAINPTAGQFTDGTSGVVNSGNGAQVQLNDGFIIPLVVQEGERITQVSGRIIPDGAGDIIRMRVYRVDATGTGFPIRTQLGSTATSVSGTTSQTLTVSGLTETVGTSLFTYHVEFFTTAVVVNAVNVTGVLLTTDVP